MYCIQCGEKSLSSQGTCKKCGALLPTENIEEKPYKILQFLSQPLPFFIALLLIITAIGSLFVWRHLNTNRDDPADAVELFYEAVAQQDKEAALEVVVSAQQDSFSRSLTFLTGSEEVSYDFRDLRYKTQDDFEQGDKKAEVRVTGTIIVSIGDEQQEDSFRDDVEVISEDNQWKIKTSDITEIIVL